jgi:hypothetical protein
VGALLPPRLDVAQPTERPVRRRGALQTVPYSSGLTTGTLMDMTVDPTPGLCPGTERAARLSEDDAKIPTWRVLYRQ